MSEPLILQTVEGRVATLTLNRPSALNALNGALMVELVAALQGIDANPAISVVVLTGSEKAFAAGADIKEMHGLSYSDAIAQDFAANYVQVARTRKPIIAAVNGYALGGGLELVMMCDMIIASTTAKFGQPEVTLGVMPGIGGSQRLTRLVGRAKAMDMCLTGTMIDAQEALQFGLVSRVFPSETMLADVQGIAQDMAQKSLPALMYIKEAVHRAEEVSLSEGLLFERRLFQMLFGTTDKMEGMAAFLEKRKPKFENR